MASQAGNLTFVQGDRSIDEMDEVSRKIMASGSGTSIFDPVLCELAYSWFCPPGGVVVDPFAGGSVRGIVAAKLERQYIGIELRPEQVDANRGQSVQICAEDRFQPVWHVGDSRRMDRILDGVQADFVFSCPPYADLERYSDDPSDLSNMPYDEFLSAYREIIAKSVALLADDSFACFVIGDVRDKRGFLRGLPWHTIQAFEDAGCKLYNDVILVNAVGSLAIRAGRQFKISRKIGKTHQYVFVFCKGDPKKATQRIGDVSPQHGGEIDCETDCEIG